MIDWKEVFFTRGDVSYEFFFPSGDMSNLAYIGTKNLNFWPITGFVYFETKILLTSTSTKLSSALMSAWWRLGRSIGLRYKLKV